MDKFIEWIFLCIIMWVVIGVVYLMACFIFWEVVEIPYLSVLLRWLSVIVGLGSYIMVSDNFR